jgi:methylmalonyl-CoA/ethylmalonyl-CoA epimerase
MVEGVRGSVSILGVSGTERLDPDLEDRQCPATLGDQFKQHTQPTMTLHHVGFVVKSIVGVAADFARSARLQWNGEIIHDPLQGARVSFLVPSTPGPPVIELVEPARPDSPVQAFQRRGGGLHHLCYEVDSHKELLNGHLAQHDFVVRAPLPAVAFAGRRIAWVYTRYGLLLEYLER